MATKSNAYTRLIKEIKFDENKPLCEYTTNELVAYVLDRYPQDPIGAVNRMYSELEIGRLLYHPTVIILEGMGYVKKY